MTTRGLLLHSTILLIVFQLNILQESLASGNVLLKSQEAEEVNVRVLTKSRHRRSLHRHEFHVLQVDRPGNGSFQIHLAKTDQLLSPNFSLIIKDGQTNTTVTLNRDQHAHLLNIDSPPETGGSCVFAGVISNSDVQGKVVLSACGKNPGFSGVIITPTAAYVMEPILVKAKESHSHILHKLSHLENPYADGAATCGGSIYPKEPVERMPASNAPENFRSFSNSGRSPMVSTFRRGKSRPLNKKSSTGENYVVELAIFTDESFVAHLKKEWKTTSTKPILGYIYTLVQIMQIFYESPTLEKRIQFKIVQLELLTKNPSTLKTSHTSLTQILQSFCTYARKLNPSGRKWDHAMLLTAEDLREGKSTSPIGVAYTKAACSINAACSVLEYKAFSTGHTMAHELGHNIGMEHDGVKGNSDCDGKMYLMAAQTGIKQTSWSTCSNRNLNDYLKLLNSDRYSDNCLLKASTLDGSSSHEFKIQELPGEHFSAAIQCAMANKKRPIPVLGQLLSRYKLPLDICSGLYCTDKEKLYAVMIHPALEGTTCASGKWCKQGVCVSKGSISRSGK